MYYVRIEDRVKKEIRNFPNDDIQRINKALDGLKENPRPPGCLKLTNQPGYRIRTGHYRILYKIEDEIKTVTIYRIKRRSESTYKE